MRGNGCDAKRTPTTTSTDDDIAVFGDAEERSSPRKVSSSDDDLDDAYAREWPRRQVDANDNVHGR